jgi:hypothetical protein
VTVPTISTRAMGVIADDLGLGLPYPLEVRPRGATAAERAELRAQVEEELRDSGLLDHTGQVESRLTRWLRLLARPEVSVDSAFLPALGSAPVRAIVARSRRSAVLATQIDDEAVRLRQVPVDQLGEVIVELLPDAGRGTESSISLPVTDEERGGQTLAEDRQTLARLTAAPRERGGQIAANSFSDLGRRRRSPVLSWFDNGTGRYFAQQRAARDGRRWVTVAPADAATLRVRIGEMVRNVTS